ncbi:MAG TPA: acyltransferase [Bryobacteraceae bacterium]|nr:acyltransferase [Bryobacteraceae bacterium]
MPQQSPAHRDTIRALTGVRFLAAFHVVCFHYASGPIGLPFARHIIENGWMAVNLFFILSGFVLTYNYAERQLAAQTFWVARFARIYPAYLLGFVLIAPAVAVRLGSHPMKLLGCAAATGGLVQGWFPSIALTWNGPGWSLSSEAFFYLLFPFLLPVCARLSDKKLLLAIILSCGVEIAIPAIDILAYGSKYGHAILYMPIFRLPDFILGIMTAQVYLRGWRNFPARGMLFAVSMALAVFTAVLFPVVPADFRAPLATPLFALMVYSLAGDRGLLARFLACRPIYALGDASYSVYILQSPIMAYYLYFTQRSAATLSVSRAPLGWGGFILYSAILIGLSLGCYTYIERPARLRISALWSNRIWTRPARSDAVTIGNNGHGMDELNLLAAGVATAPGKTLAQHDRISDSLGVQ